jgi:hypothetical protein
MNHGAPRCDAGGASAQIKGRTMEQTRREPGCEPRDDAELADRELDAVSGGLEAGARALGELIYKLVSGARSSGRGSSGSW